MPKETSKSRGRYASQACTFCRTKKTKCDGVKPVCGPCTASGRNNECAWGKDTAVRKPRTDALFEALRKRADSLQAYVDLLEGLLEKCVCQDVSSHRQFRPQPTREDSTSTTREDGDVDEEGNSDLPSDEEVAQDLTIPMSRLKVDHQYGGLLRHGITAAFRFLGTPPDPVPEAFESDPDATYILHVDGMDIAACHPDIDWSRHLPPGVLLDRTEHDKILSLSFKFSLMWCLRIVPSLFFRDMYRALSVSASDPRPRTPHYSPMLHNAILALSVIFSDDPYIRDPKIKLHFADAAKACLEAECRRPDLALAQALALIGTLYGDLGDRIYGDLFFGMSDRISTALGLNIDSSASANSGLMTRDEELGRGWAYWSWVSVDICLAACYGRDCSVGRRTISMPFVDSEYDQIPWHHPSVPAQPNLLTLVFNRSTTLFLIMRKIIDIVNGLTGRVRQDDIRFDEQITRIDLELNNWKSELPPELDITLANRTKSTPQKLMLHLQYWWAFIVLHQPLFPSNNQIPFQHSDPQVDHVKLSTRAAENILELLETWSSLYTLRFSPITLLQIIFSAGTVFLLRALHATTNQRIAHAALKTALAQAEQCVRYLHEMGQAWHGAAVTGDTLQAVLHQKLLPVIAKRLARKGDEIPAATSSPEPVAPASDLGGLEERILFRGNLDWTLAQHAPTQDWSQTPLPFFTQSGLGTELSQPPYSSAPDSYLPQSDMAGFPPDFDRFPELWEQELLASSDLFNQQ
ncbi:hypothetical protein C8R46DRAFT_669176 [Mycena filopes]|nr:hypothetical protein C8R46DRAFT_669176 [Mycena filopes]